MPTICHLPLDSSAHYSALAHTTSLQHTPLLDSITHHSTPAMLSHIPAVAAKIIVFEALLLAVMSQLHLLTLSYL